METPAAIDDNRRLTRSRTRGGAPTPPTPTNQETRGRKRTNSAQSSASKKGKKSDEAASEDLSKPQHAEQIVKATPAKELEPVKKGSEVAEMDVDNHTPDKNSESTTKLPEENDKSAAGEESKKVEDKKDVSNTDNTEKTKLPETSVQKIDSGKIVENVNGDEPTSEPEKKASDEVETRVDGHTRQSTTEGPEENDKSAAGEGKKEEDKKDEFNSDDATKTKLPETSEQKIDSEKVVENVKGDEPIEPEKTGVKVTAKIDKPTDKVAEITTD